MFNHEHLIFLSDSVRCSHQPLISQDGLTCYETKDGGEEGETSDYRKMIVSLALMDEYRQQDVPCKMEQDTDQTKGGLTGTLLIYKYGVKAEGRC